MGSVYTVEQLLALRGFASQFPLPPQGEDHASRCRLGSYFALWRKYQALIQEGPVETGQQYPVTVVYRYDFVLSNKEFKRRWVKSHGTSAGLKDLPRRMVNIRSIRVKFLEDYFKSIARLERRLQNLYGKIRKNFSDKTSDSQKYIPPAKRVPTTLRKKSSSSKRPPKAFRVTPIKSGTPLITINELGGRVATFDPSAPPVCKHWGKYWYFYRKRGLWKPSEHHPYGDESIHLSMKGSSA